jgi:transcription initiation factor TFIIIB Brf1 subunit/transcription initiation factor TFIIB
MIKARTGSPVSLAKHDMGLNTVIGNNNKDSSGQNIEPSMHSTMRRLRTYDFRQANAFLPIKLASPQEWILKISGFQQLLA